MKFGVLTTVLLVASNVGTDAFQPRSIRERGLSLANNADMFGAGGSDSSVKEAAPVAPMAAATANDGAGKGQKLTPREQKAMDAADALRREAEEMELALREEARSKGMPEEVINKLVPIRPQTKTKAAQKIEEKVTGVAAPKPVLSRSDVVEEVAEASVPSAEIRSKLGYLNTGDAVRITSELDRLKGKGTLRLWNSHEKALTGARFSVNNMQLKEKAKIEPQQLKLDDVGYDYQKTFLVSLAVASTFGIASSLIPEDFGPMGFLMGYASALFPILIVGVGSIAPGLIGDVLQKFKLSTDSEAKERFIDATAGKFLVGYIMGLPVSRFASNGPSNSVEFFQLRPSGNEENDRKMFSENKFKQADIARSSAVCLASSVAECMAYDEASGTAPGDVNTLYELMQACDPKIEGEKLQDHIRWSALEAFKVLDKYPTEFARLKAAFKENLPLEECIACIEGTGDVLARENVP